MLSKNVTCPQCGRTAVITLFEEIDPVHGTDGHRIEFRCVEPQHALDESAKLILWAADRVQSANTERESVDTRSPQSG